jgi:hypothetical protein
MENIMSTTLEHYLTTDCPPFGSTSLWDQFGTSSGSTGLISNRINPVNGLSDWLARILLAPEDTPQALSSAEVPQALAQIRDAFSLTTVQLSQVLLVSRQAIYDWSLAKPVKQEHRQRIAHLRELAIHWRELHPQPMGKIVNEEIEGTTLLSLLNAETLNQQAIQALLLVIASKLAAAATARPATARELAAKHGLQPISEAEYQRNLQHASLRFGRKG